VKNFHLPLPDRTYQRLKEEADRAHLPATVLAREAIDIWLKQQARKARHEAIATYAAEMAGTTLDLDAGLEAAGVEHLSSLKMKRGKIHRGGPGGIRSESWVNDDRGC
jgi:hypothetical protein